MHIRNVDMESEEAQALLQAGLSEHEIRFRLASQALYRNPTPPNLRSLLIMNHEKYMTYTGRESNEERLDRLETFVTVMYEILDVMLVQR